MKSETMICLSQMTAKPGKEKELEKALKALVSPTLNEPGCLAYELWQDAKNPRSFIMYERFQNAEALEAHVAIQHIQHFIHNAYKTCVESHWDAEFHSLII
jgi:quinol monooxygenase YgiN